MNDQTGASQEVEWFVEEWADDKDSASKVWPPSIAALQLIGACYRY